MDWDVEPTATAEFVTINRGPTPPSDLIYSDDNGFGDNLPVLGPGGGDGERADQPRHGERELRRSRSGRPRRPLHVRLRRPRRGREQAVLPLLRGSRHGGRRERGRQRRRARGLLLRPAEHRRAAPTLGTPNTFIWGFRAVGGSAVIPPTLSLTPESASSDAGGTHSLTATLTDSGGAPVPGRADRLRRRRRQPDRRPRARPTATGRPASATPAATPGDDTITACLDADNSGGCDAGEVTDTATRHWNAPPPPHAARRRSSARASSSTWCPARSGSRAGTASSARSARDESIPVGSTVDATKGKVRLTSAAGRSGATQSALFYQGAFVVTQTQGRQADHAAGAVRQAQLRDEEEARRARRRRRRRSGGCGVTARAASARRAGTAPPPSRARSG